MLSGMSEDRARIRTSWAMVLLGAPLAAVAQPAFHVIGQGTNEFRTSATAVSGDGAFVVGWTYGPVFGGHRAFRWSAPGGYQDLGTPTGGFGSWGAGVSGDGSVVVGWYTTAIPDNALRWSLATGTQRLSIGAGIRSERALAVSADGTAIVGSTGEWSSAGSPQRAYLWSQGVTIDLGVLPQTTASIAMAVSGDGAVVVGRSWVAGNAQTYRAFRWTAAEGMEPLTDMVSEATGVSGDGRVIVGRQGTRGFRWTAGDGFEYIPALPGATSISPNGVSPDGRVVVGTSLGRPFVWTRLHGTVDLVATLPSRGVNIEGWQLVSANAVSTHGSTIVGDAVRGSEERGYRISGIEWWCVADVDDGSGTGQDDEAVTIDDLIYFIRLYTDGDPGADFDDGSFTGLFDGGVTIDDLLYFLHRFALGC
jgi:uncharacterized membrane protein